MRSPDPPARGRDGDRGGRPPAVGMDARLWVAARPRSRRTRVSAGDHPCHDVEIALRLPGGTADEEPVDVRLGREGGAIAGIDAAAVENARVAARHVAQGPLDHRVLRIGEAGFRRRAALADRPHRLVGDHHAIGIGGREARDRSANLPVERLGGAAGRVFGARVADAHERRQAMPQRRLDLQGDGVVGLAEVFPALAVPDLGQGRAGVGRHPGRDLARPGAGVRPMDVLHPDPDPRAAQQRRHFDDCRERRDDEELRRVAMGRRRRREGLGEGAGLGPHLVHLPARADPERVEGHGTDPLRPRGRARHRHAAPRRRPSPAFP